MPFEQAELARDTARAILARASLWHRPDQWPLAMVDLEWLCLRVERDDWYTGDIHRLRWLANAVGVV